MASVDPADRGGEAAIAPEALVGKFDHPGVRPGLRPDLHQPVDQGDLEFTGKGLRQDHQHCCGRAGNAHMAMDQQVTHVASVASESKDRLDVRHLWQHDVGRGLDRIVEIERRSDVRIVG